MIRWPYKDNESFEGFDGISEEQYMNFASLDSHGTVGVAERCDESGIL